VLQEQQRRRPLDRLVVPRGNDGLAHSGASRCCRSSGGVGHLIGTPCHEGNDGHAHVGRLGARHLVRLVVPRGNDGLAHSGASRCCRSSSGVGRLIGTPCHEGNDGHAHVGRLGARHLVRLVVPRGNDGHVHVGRLGARHLGLARRASGAATALPRSEVSVLLCWRFLQGVFDFACRVVGHRNGRCR